MLEALLAEIRAGGAFEIGSLASRLGTTTEMVAAALDHLRRLGYIRGYAMCGEGCGGCSLRQECRAGSEVEPSRRSPQLLVWTSGEERPLARAGELPADPRS